MLNRGVITAVACLVAGAVPYAPAHAAVEPYSIHIKDSATTPTVLGSGGLSFNNALEVAGPDQELSPESSPSPSITVTTASFLPPVIRPFTFDTIDPTTPLKVVVSTNKLCKAGDRGSNPDVIEGLDQGPNVEGLKYRLTGTKVVGPTTYKLALNFKLTKTAITCPDGQTAYTYTRLYDVERYWTLAAACAPSLPPCWKPVSLSNKYAIWNPKSVSPLPEPSSLALLLMGSIAAGWALRRRAKTTNYPTA